MALLAPEMARMLAPHMRGWMTGARVLLAWWDQQSQAYSDRYGTPCRSQLPHVLLTILDQGTLLPPSVWSRAESVAVKIREWMHVDRPDMLSIGFEKYFSPRQLFLYGSIMQGDILLRLSVPHGSLLAELDSLLDPHAP